MHLVQLVQLVLDGLVQLLDVLVPDGLALALGVLARDVHALDGLVQLVLVLLLVHEQLLVLVQLLLGDSVDHYFAHLDQLVGHSQDHFGQLIH